MEPTCQEAREEMGRMATKTRDPEASTFQRRPCYRYIRASDRLPALGTEDGLARIKLFDPTGSWTWYISEYDPETRRAYGRVKGIYTEYGYFEMAELVDFRGRFGLPIERDLHWTPRPLAECN
jgi:hypothetical protein